MSASDSIDEWANECWFEDWCSLAQSDPQAFENRRERMIDRFLAKSAQRQQILGIFLQREIDACRARATSADDSLRVLAKMLAEQLTFLGEEFAGLGHDIKAVTRPWSQEKH